MRELSIQEKTAIDCLEKFKTYNEEAFKYLIENYIEKGYFSAYNDKLYDVFYILNGTTRDENDFQEFCENSWYLFQETLEKYGCETEQIGRTSSFYIRDKNFEKFTPYYLEFYGENITLNSFEKNKESFYNDSLNELLLLSLLDEENIIEETFYEDSNILLLDNIEKIKSGDYPHEENEIINKYLNEITFICNSIIKIDYKNKFDTDLYDLKQTVDWLKTFKENQVDLFNEFKEFIDESYEEQHEEEKNTEFLDTIILVKKDNMNHYLHFIGNENISVYDFRKRINELIGESKTYEEFLEKSSKEFEVREFFISDEFNETDFGKSVILR